MPIDWIWGRLGVVWPMSRPHDDLAGIWGLAVDFLLHRDGRRNDGTTTGDTRLRKEYLKVMDIRPLTPDFAVAPQISADDIAVLKEQGFTHIICNRPAFESAPADAPEVIRAAAAQAGLGWTENPMAGGQLSMEMIEAQRQAGKVLAYCASGTRSAILWGLSQAGTLPTDDILRAMADGGYPMEQMRGQLDMLASQNGAS